MTFFAFIAALAFAILVHEVVSAIQIAVVGRWNNPLNTPILTHSDLPRQQRRTTLEAILLAVFPKRFDERQATNVTDVVGLLRRSGYVYATPGEFYTAAIRDFSQFLLIGMILAVGLIVLDMPVAAVPILAIYIVLGLRRP
jgi:hypothetical protein